MQWNRLQVRLFYSFHLRKSKVQSYFAFADLSNIFLIQSLMFSTVACNATPVRHLCYVNYITPFPRNVSLGRLWFRVIYCSPQQFSMQICVPPSGMLRELDAEFINMYFVSQVFVDDQVKKFMTCALLNFIGIYYNFQLS